MISKRMGPAFIFTCMVLAAFITGAGCISQPTDQGNPSLTATESPTLTMQATGAPVTLKGITWELVSYDSGRIAQESVTLGSTVTARFEPGGILYGSSGCNQYFASYETKGSNLLISAPQHTRLRCQSPPGVESQEKAYLIDLEKVRTFSIDGDILRLSDETGRVVLLFRRGEIPPGIPGISWKTWHLSSYRDNSGIVVGIPDTMVMTTRFLDGTISGFSGCNCYLGQYQEDGGAMEIKDLVVTDTNCRNDTVMGAERAFLNNLKGTTAYIQSDDRLLLVNDRGDSLLTYDTKAVFP